MITFYQLQFFSSPPKRLVSEESEAASEGSEEEMEDEEEEPASQAVTPRRNTPLAVQYPTPPPRIDQSSRSSGIQTPRPPRRIDPSPSGTLGSVDRVHEGIHQFACWVSHLTRLVSP